MSYLGDVQRKLTGTEIATFLIYHPIIASRVALFDVMVGLVGFDQIYTPPATLTLLGYSIPLDWDLDVLPASGLCVADSNYGNVLVAPSANGTLYYNAFVDSGHCAAAQKVDDQSGAYNLYQSPPNPDPNACDPSDLLCNLNKDLGIAWTVFLGFAGLYVYNSLKK